MPSLKDLTLTVGDVYDLAIPDPVDFDGDDWTIDSFKISPSPSFISGEYPNYQIAPTTNSDAGTFKVTIQVSDANYEPLSATYTFNIKVKPLVVTKPSSPSVPTNVA